MKIVLNIFLTLLATVLAVWLFFIIRKPIIEKQEFKVKKAAIVKRLENVRKAQFAYKDVKNKFADNWDSLIHTIKYDNFEIIKTIGDPNDSSIVTTYDTILIPVMDSVFKEKVCIDSLKFIPYTKDAIFDLQASSINQRGVDVHVFQVTDSKPYNQKYIDKGEARVLQLGSMSEVNYSGNWR